MDAVKIYILNGVTSDLWVKIIECTKKRFVVTFCALNLLTSFTSCFMTLRIFLPWLFVVRVRRRKEKFYRMHGHLCSEIIAMANLKVWPKAK